MGDQCYNAFQNESGIHRVQRIPPTEAKGRVHTSIINVVVLNGAINEAKIPQNMESRHLSRQSGAINENESFASPNRAKTNYNILDNKDLRITYYKASGAGGQHRNKTMSGVRLQYKDEIIECCEGRSQHKNKEIAFKRLEEILHKKKKIKNKEILVKQERKQNKNKGKRGNFHRNYNFQRNEISQNGYTYPLKEFMKGKVDIIK